MRKLNCRNCTLARMDGASMLNQAQMSKFHEGVPDYDLGRSLAKACNIKVI